MDYDKLAHWYGVAEDLKDLKQKEKKLRDAIIKEAFPELKEGVNTLNMPDGVNKIKADYKINRTIDSSLVQVVGEELEKKCQTSLDSLISWKPTIKLSEYRKLNAKQRKIFDKLLTIKPGSVSLEVK